MYKYSWFTWVAEFLFRFRISNKRFRLKKWMKWLLGIAVSIMILFLLLFVGLSHYVNTYKKELIEKITAALHQKISGDVSIEDLNVNFFLLFPGFSSRLMKVRFAEIRNNLKLENAGVHIERMAINSSVLTLFLHGVYGLKNNTDISIQVPLKNLSKKQDEAHPEFIRGDSKGGMSVFLRASSDKDGKINIKYDPLARFRKK